MRSFVSLLLVLALPAHALGAPVITEVLPDPGTEREFIEIHNPGNATFDLSGWTVRDAAGNTFTFANRSLPAGARLVVWGGGSDDARGPAWSRASVWNNGGDQAFLFDANGTLIDAIGYGSEPWPTGNASSPAAPDTGKSLALAGGTWLESQPTPGMAPDGQSANVAATVQDAPPTATFVDPPAEAAPGQTVTLQIHVGDPNGDTDLATWELTGDGAWLANGTDAGVHDLTVQAPSDRDTWRLVLTATDQGGNSTQVEHVVAIETQGLVVVVPPGGLAFPPFPPGASQVLALGNISLRNDADQVLTPRIDVSDFSGPATIPVAGHLDIGTRTGPDATWTWTTYDGPLTGLPDLAPGAGVEATLRLRDLPTPLPAGTYGTSFTVVA